MGKGMGGHQSTSNMTNTWLTPQWILEPLGVFDLDPCAAIGQPWPTAKTHYTEKENGLLLPWFGRVWMNPPYSTELIRKFMKLMAEHNNGISLVFARTETAFFKQYVFPVCSSILFFDRRIKFNTLDGSEAKGSGGAPSVLIAYDESNSQSISEAKLPGHHLPVNTIPIVVVGVSPSWTSVVTIAINRNGGEADLATLYSMVETIAPDKCQQNSFFKEKIRQVMQTHFERIAKGKYKTKNSINENQTS